MKKKIPSIKSVMTPFPYWIEIDDSIVNAKKMMEEHNIHHLPVKEKGNLAGVISDKIIQITQANSKLVNSNISVREICILNPYIVDLMEPLDIVAYQMAERKVSSALVVKQGRLAGIFSSVDACRCLANLLRSHHDNSSSDDDLVA
jgi:acetoin utilization protein AcuB